MESMTIHEGLAELKLISKKLSKKSSSGFINYKKLSSCNIVESTVDVNTYKESAKGNMQSILDLYKRQSAIKSAIVKANATTIIDIMGESMTISDAIDRKKFEEDKLNFAVQLLSEYRSVCETVEDMNENAMRRVDDSVSRMYSSVSEGVNSEDAAKYREVTYNSMAFEVVDGLGLESMATKMYEDSESYLSKIDAKLSIANATTFIEV